MEHMILLKEMLILTTFLFFTGMVCVVLYRKNIITTIISIELMLLAVNLNFLIIAQQFNDIVSHIFVLVILTIAASESAIGLAMLTLYHNTKNTITFDVVKNQNFNPNIRKRQDLNLQFQRFIFTGSFATGTLKRIKNLFKPSSGEFMFTILIVSLLFLSFLLIYTGSLLHDLDLKQQEVNYQNLRIALLEEEVETLNQLIKELQRPKIIRGFRFLSFWSDSNDSSDSIGPSLKYLGMAVSVVVVLVVCAYVWPAHILTLKKGIAEYISSFMGTKDTTFTALSTDGSGLEWLVKIYENKHLEIFVKTRDGTEFMPINNYLELINFCLEEATAYPGYPYHDDVYGLFNFVYINMAELPIIPL